MKAVRRVKKLTCFHMTRILSYQKAYVTDAYISSPTAGVTEYRWYLNVAVITPLPLQRQTMGWNLLRVLSDCKSFFNRRQYYWFLHTGMAVTSLIITGESRLERRCWWGKWLRIYLGRDQMYVEFVRYNYIATSCHPFVVPGTLHKAFNSHNKTKKRTNVKIIFFIHNF